MTSNQVLERLKNQQYLPIGGISNRVLHPLELKGLIAIINTVDGLMITKLRK